MEFINLGDKKINETLKYYRMFFFTGHIFLLFISYTENVNIYYNVYYKNFQNCKTETRDVWY